MTQESVQALCHIEMSCNTWRAWVRCLHAQSCSVPSLLFLPLFSSPSARSWAPFAWAEALHPVISSLSSREGDCPFTRGDVKPRDEPCSGLCVVATVVSNYRSRRSLWSSGALTCFLLKFDFQLQLIFLLITNMIMAVSSFYLISFSPLE